MSIEANLLNDDCTSLDGWLIEELGQWDVLEGNFHFQGVEDSGACLKEIASSTDQVTVEINLILDTLVDPVQLVFSTNADTATVEFKPTGVYEGSSDLKICDIDLTETVWRVQYDSTAQTVQLFKDGVSQGTLTGVEGFGALGITGFNAQDGSDGHILYVKAGEGLGDFGGSTTYTVTYDGNGNTGGSVPVDASSPYDENDTVTVLGNTGSLVKTGYTFDGWNTASDGSGTDYAPAATFQMPASNTTLYAQWIESGDKIQLKNISLIKPALEKISLTTPCLIKSK